MCHGRQSVGPLRAGRGGRDPWLAAWHVLRAAGTPDPWVTNMPQKAWVAGVAPPAESVPRGPGGQVSSASVTPWAGCPADGGRCLALPYLF